MLTLPKESPYYVYKYVHFGKYVTTNSTKKYHYQIIKMLFIPKHPKNGCRCVSCFHIYLFNVLRAKYDMP